jgi:hypothetical protein
LVKERYERARVKRDKELELIRKKEQDELEKQPSEAS